MEFWHDLITEKSWRVLQEIKKEIDFILIGGWAIYLWTNAFKSKDIDIIIELKELYSIKSKFDIIKNENLKKYEIKKEGIDIEIYAPFYSRLSIPAEDLINYTTKIEGFKVLKKEALLILKQGSEKDRSFSEKGLKDRIDILLLLFKEDFNFKEYYSLIKKYNLKDFPQRLKEILANFKEIEYINLNPREYKLKKNKVLKKLKEK